MTMHIVITNIVLHYHLREEMFFLTEFPVMKMICVERSICVPIHENKSKTPSFFIGFSTGWQSRQVKSVQGALPGLKLYMATTYTEVWVSTSAFLKKFHCRLWHCLLKTVEYRRQIHEKQMVELSFSPLLSYVMPQRGIHSQPSPHRPINQTPDSSGPLYLEGAQPWMVNVCVSVCVCVCVCVCVSMSATWPPWPLYCLLSCWVLACLDRGFP